MAEKWHTTIEPYRTEDDQSLDELTDEERAEIDRQVEELHHREAAGERVGH
ncbi:hypothetical protein [Nesterenkonia pannonica]|uniref:hypothetical protein n=1 Tax=Nesterenkonia pannonica TaxID=1548602 RepID=UPI0021648A0D|nr:hypothetical protein [Nesterenkonia pannonica]